MIQKYIIDKRIRILIILVVFLLPVFGFGCNVCRGNPNSALTAGMDMAILTLLGFIGFVLSAFASFFMYLKKKAKLIHLKVRN